MKRHAGHGGLLHFPLVHEQLEEPLEPPVPVVCRGRLEGLKQVSDKYLDMLPADMRHFPRHPVFIQKEGELRNVLQVGLLGADRGVLCMQAAGEGACIDIHVLGCFNRFGGSTHDIRTTGTGTATEPVRFRPVLIYASAGSVQ